ncbi:MAG: NUDIX domain-containing protein [Lentilitoribacter sp.]
MQKKSFLEKLRNKIFHTWFLLTRSMTMGVRVAAFNDKEHIFLVRHTYVSGWHLPGGGIERGEAALEAVHKELWEEGNLLVKGEAKLLAVFYNTHVTNRDHVLFYKCNVEQTEIKQNDHEIAEAGFFDLASLPEGVTSATQRRIDEIAAGLGHPVKW